MGDVNKGVWPSEVRRSNDVNKNNIDPPPKKCNKKPDHNKRGTK